MTGGIRPGVPIRAVSEFLVIVVGVLVALGVDSWASERADRTAEVEYLEQLATELRLDSALFAGFLMPNVIEARAALTRVRMVAAAATPIAEDTAAILSDVRSGLSPLARLGRSTTFQELLSTGSLRLIESSPVRSAILRYYETKTLSESRISYRTSNYADIVRGYLPNTLGPESIERAARVFAADGFEESITRHEDRLRLEHGVLEVVLTEASSLLGLVDAELNQLR